MTYNTDGNLAALRQYECQQDKIYQAEERLETARQELADDLFDGYMSDNYSVIDEVDARMVASRDTIDNLLKKLRDNFTTDCQAMRTQYMKIIACVCEEIAGEYDDMAKAYKDFEI